MPLCRQLSCVLVLAIFCALPVFAQETEENHFDGRSIGRVWYSRINAGQFFGYIEKVRKDLEIERSGIMMFASPVSVRGATAKLSGKPQDDEVKGMLLYLVTSPKAGFQQISFRNIKDETAFRQYVLQQKQRFGDSAELKGKGNKYSVTVKFGTVRLPTADSGDTANQGETKKKTVVFSVGIATRVGGASTGPTPTMPTEMTTYYRYNDGVIYEGQYEKLHDIKPPKSKTLQPSTEQASHDLFADIDLAEIPAPMKELAWTTLQKQASVYLQRFDKENATDYSLRRAFGEGRLKMIKAGIFDLDRVQFRFSMAESDDTPIRANLKLTARDNSPLSKQLAMLNRETSRFSGLAAQDAPMVAVSTMRLPQWARDMLAARVKSLRTDLEISLAEDVDSLLAVNELLAVFDDTIHGAKGDAMVRLIGDATNGFRVHGGLRVADSQKLARSIELLLNRQATNGDNVFVETQTVGDHRVMTLRANDTPVPFAAAGTAVPIELHLTTQGSYVWFCIGDEAARNLLVESLKIDNRQQNRVAGTPIDFRFSLKDWLGGDEDESSFNRIPQLALQRLEQAISGLMPSRMTININGKTYEPNEKEPIPSYLTKALTPENGNVQLRVDTNGRSLEADLELGTGIAKLALAQYIESQNRMFKSLPFDMEMLRSKDGKSMRIKSGSGAIRIGR